MTREDEIRTRLAKATPGPWYWYGNLKTKEVALTSMVDGHVTVMDFVRWGMNSAAPSFRVDGIMSAIQDDGMVTTRKPHTNDFYVVNHPDAKLIANAPADIDYLLKENQRLREQWRTLGVWAQNDINMRTGRGQWVGTSVFASLKGAQEVLSIASEALQPKEEYK